MNLSVLYRGSLSSCNYSCGYCPFAKRGESSRRLIKDKTSLDRFVNWISQETSHQWRVLFTPWGEALVRSWYRKAIVRLSHSSHIESVAAQTNLSCGLDWLDECERSKVAIWATFHPTEVELSTFVHKINRVNERGVRLSVGVVGITSAFAAIRELRRSLAPDIYVWVNAQQPRPRPYSRDELEFLASIDPHFPATSRPQQTLGHACRSGHSSFTVDGQGDMRRCHFVDGVIGNIHDTDWQTTLMPRNCPNRTCHCYLGLSQFEPLQLEQIFGKNLLERIPSDT